MIFHVLHATWAVSVMSSIMSSGRVPQLACFLCECSQTRRMTSTTHVPPLNSAASSPCQHAGNAADAQGGCNCPMAYEQPFRHNADDPTVRQHEYCSHRKVRTTFHDHLSGTRVARELFMEWFLRNRATSIFEIRSASAVSRGRKNVVLSNTARLPHTSAQRPGHVSEPLLLP